MKYLLVYHDELQACLFDSFCLPFADAEMMIMIYRIFVINLQSLVYSLWKMVKNFEKIHPKYFTLIINRFDFLKEIDLNCTIDRRFYVVIHRVVFSLVTCPKLFCETVLRLWFWFLDLPSLYLYYVLHLPSYYKYLNS